MEHAAGKWLAFYVVNVCVRVFMLLFRFLSFFFLRKKKFLFVSRQTPAMLGEISSWQALEKEMNKIKER